MRSDIGRAAAMARLAQIIASFIISQARAKYFAALFFLLDVHTSSSDFVQILRFN
jgi:hypothetical protein